MANDDRLVLDPGPAADHTPHAVGRASFGFVDEQRGRREMVADVWYPTPDRRGTPSIYEVIPGVAYRSALALDAPAVAVGRWPMVLMSHGRTGTRIAYASLCEQLAGRGAVVVAADHLGDGLVDWLSGTQTDDDTNERNRVGDALAVLDALRHAWPGVPVEVANNVDLDHVILAGHSYGAYTALAVAAGERGAPPVPGVRGVIGLQPYTRSLPDGALARVRVPTLFVVSGMDRTTPAAVDADRPCALVPGRPLWRLDLPRSGHQASSDTALYAELVTEVPQVPEIVRAYLASSVDAPDDGRPATPWRRVISLEAEVCWQFAQLVGSGDANAVDDVIDDVLAAHGSVGARLHRYA